MSTAVRRKPSTAPGKETLAKAGIAQSPDAGQRTVRMLAKISDPANAHLFTAEAAYKAFAHLKKNPS